MASLLLKDSPMRSLLAWATLVVLVAACRPDGAEVVPGAEGWLGGAAPSIAMPETRPGPGSSDETGALQAHQGLRAWLDEYTRAGHADRSPLELQGARLALQRRLALRALLLVDPERALTLAMSPVLRAQLPEAVAQHVERWRDGRGTLHVLCAMSAEGQEPAPLQRFVTFDGEDRFLRAGVFGARLGQQTREHARLHGVELDGVIALTESPLRQLSAGETSRALLDEVESPASGPSARAQLFHDGDAPRRLCAEGCAAALASQLEQEEDAAALQAAPLEASSWTEGPKPVLFIRVDFSDLAGDPVSEPSAKTLIESTVSNFFKGASYDKTSMTAVVTPTLRMTKTSAEYLATEAYPQLMTDARAAAKAAGFDTAGYTLDLIAFKRLFSGWAGMGYVGGKGTWLNGSFDLRVTAHELGHNYGSSHANFWSAGPSIIGAGTNVEYGNPLDIMGNTGTSNAHHFSSWVKRRFDWMTAGETQLVAASGTYRVHALETVIASGLHALKIPRNDSQRRDYWLEFRPGFNNVHQKNGVSIHFGYQFASTSHLLDMTPEGDRTSSALLIGRTFSDRLAGIHLTPVGKGGTTPESVDVVVNLGSFPGNRAPTLSLEAGATSVPVNTSVTFTATAGDPDGDALAYAWDFDDGSIWPNAPVVTKALSAQRVYSARCTVSDMKGQVTTAAVAVTVGSPTKFTLSGIITAGGQPLEGVRVSDGSRGTFTASDGHYLLAEVPAGTFTLAATNADYSFTAGFASPLAVSGSVSDLDFTATPSPGYTVSGTVTASGVGLAGVTVTDGSRSATTNSTGAFSLALVPNGRWMLAAAKAGWEFSPSGFTNPLEVN